MLDSIKEHKIIDYDPVDRTYGILFGGGYIMFLKYCPWCGVKLKQRLLEEFYDILETEYGIKDPDIVGLTNVPEEFKTDEWWRKRGL